jgi:threonine dehydrogenase-like Zn-dependent dehydrogenase
MGAAINRGPTFRMAQTPVQHYQQNLLERIEKGEIDPSFVITHRAPREEGPDLYKKITRQTRRLHQGRDEAIGTTPSREMLDQTRSRVGPANHV